MDVTPPAMSSVPPVAPPPVKKRGPVVAGVVLLVLLAAVVIALVVPVSRQYLMSLFQTASIPSDLTGGLYLSEATGVAFVSDGAMLSRFGDPELFIVSVARNGQQKGYIGRAADGSYSVVVDGRTVTSSTSVKRDLAIGAGGVVAYAEQTGVATDPAGWNVMVAEGTNAPKNLGVGVRPLVADASHVIVFGKTGASMVHTSTAARVALLDDAFTGVMVGASLSTDGTALAYTSPVNGIIKVVHITNIAAGAIEAVTEAEPGARNAFSIGAAGLYILVPTIDGTEVWRRVRGADPVRVHVFPNSYQISALAL